MAQRFSALPKKDISSKFYSDFFLFSQIYFVTLLNNKRCDRSNASIPVSTFCDNPVPCLSIQRLTKTVKTNLLSFSFVKE